MDLSVSSYRQSTDGHPNSLLLLLLVVGMAVRLALVSLPTGLLLEKLLADDAFYYFVLARNVAAGNGVVFNSGVVTNGFHPLYAALLVPIYGLFSDINTPVRASLVLCAVFNTATGIPMYLLGTELRSKIAGLAAAGWWLLNPFVIFVSLVGLEAPVQIFFVATLVWFLVSREPTWKSMDSREWMVTGVLLALAFLSRMDMAFLAISVFGTYGIYALSRADSLGALVTDLQAPVQGGILSSALVSPWLIWSYTAVGRITPVSGEVLRWVRRENPARYGSYFDTVLYAIMQTGNHVWASFIFYDPNTYLANAVVDTIALAVLLCFVWAMYRAGRVKRLVAQLDFLLVAAILFYVYYFFVQTAMRLWYGLFTAFLLSIVVGEFASVLHQHLMRTDREKIVSIVVACVFLMFAVSGAIHYDEGTGAQERTKWRAANYIDENIPTNATLGSFNTGIYQYYTPKHEVINLDGLMNPESYDARRSDSLPAYLCQNEVRYVIDPQRDVDHLRERGIEFEKVRTFNGSAIYRLYRVTQIPGCKMSQLQT